MTRIIEEPVLLKWLKLEINRINDGVVAERRMLFELLGEEHPSAMTKSGDEYFFDKEVIRTLGAQLPKSLHYRLRLPVLFYFSMDVADSCFLTDDAAMEAFQVLGDLSRMRRMHEGRLWVSRALVFSLIEKYPKAVQIRMR